MPLKIQTMTPISIHAPAWGATTGHAAFRSLWRYFNPRTRVGCDQLLSSIVKRLSLFQSTHPRGVRHQKSFGKPVPFRFQSTHPRGVRRGWAIADIQMKKISIHAPAWGATWETCPTGGCAADFNPRTRVGCDRFRPGQRR